VCNCGKAAPTKTVWYVVYPDSSRSADFARESDARRENKARGGTGIVASAKIPE